MTWLPLQQDTTNERDAVLGLHPEAYEQHRAFLQACDGAIEPELLELCRAGVAHTLNCREELARHSPERLAAVASFEESPALSELQKQALEFVDQFLIDPAIITRELVAGLEKEMGPSGVIDFTTVIAGYEASLRLSALLDLEPAK